MSTQVIAYAVPLHLDEDPAFASRRGWGHVCATTTLAAGMRQCYGGPPYIAVGTLIERLLQPWMSSTVRLTQHARLTHILEVTRAQRPDWQPTLRAFRRNQRDALIAMRQLAEAGLHPADLRPQSAEEDAFQTLWTAMERDDRYFRDIRRRLQRDLPGSPSAFRDALARALEDDRLEHLGLVLHGFYFITPIQHLIFRLCELAGVDLAYMNYYDPRLPAVFSTWEAFFTPDTGLPGHEQWQVPASLPQLPPLGAILGAIFSGATPPATGRVTGARIWRLQDFGQLLRQFTPPLPSGSGGDTEEDSAADALWSSPES